MSLITRPINGTFIGKVYSHYLWNKTKTENADQFAHWSALIFFERFLHYFCLQKVILTAF